MNPLLYFSSPQDCTRDKELLEQDQISNQALNCEGYGDYIFLQDGLDKFCVNEDGIQCTSRYQFIDDPTFPGEDIRCCLPCQSKKCSNAFQKKYCTDPDLDIACRRNYCIDSRLSVLG